MTPCLALIWNCADPARNAAAQTLKRELELCTGWEKVVDQTGIFVCYRAGEGVSRTPYILDADKGVIFGQLFDGHRNLALLNAAACERIASSGGKELMS